MNRNLTSQQPISKSTNGKNVIKKFFLQSITLIEHIPEMQLYNFNVTMIQPASRLTISKSLVLNEDIFNAYGFIDHQRLLKHTQLKNRNKNPTQTYKQIHPSINNEQIDQSTQVFIKTEQNSMLSSQGLHQLLKVNSKITRKGQNIGYNSVNRNSNIENSTDKKLSSSFQFSLNKKSSNKSIASVPNKNNNNKNKTNKQSTKKYREHTKNIIIPKIQSSPHLNQQIQQQPLFDYDEFIQRKNITNENNAVLSFQWCFILQKMGQKLNQKCQEQQTMQQKLLKKHKNPRKKNKINDDESEYRNSNSKNKYRKDKNQTKSKAKSKVNGNKNQIQQLNRQKKKGQNYKNKLLTNIKSLFEKNINFFKTDQDDRQILLEKQRQYSVQSKDSNRLKTNFKLKINQQTNSAVKSFRQQEKTNHQMQTPKRNKRRQSRKNQRQFQSSQKDIPSLSQPHLFAIQSINQTFD